MEERIELSVIISVYNAEKYLENVWIRFVIRQ